MKHMMIQLLKLFCCWISLHTVQSTSPMYGYYYRGSMDEVNATKYDSAFEEAATIYSDYESQALEIYRIYCQQSCTQDLGLLPSRFCGICYCDVACNYYGDCCPDYPDIDQSKMVDYICMSPDIPAFGIHIKYVHSCPQHFKDVEIVNKCQQINEENWRSMQMVSDPATNVTYRNKYCSECHGVGSNALKWDIGIHCERDPPRPPFNSKEDVFLATLKTALCTILFIVPDSIPYHMCGGSDPYPRVCNVTGQWEVYDPLIERGCLTFPENEVKLYTNIFCYMCNSYYDWENFKYESVPRDPNVFRVALSALLDLDEDDADDVNVDDERCQDTDPYTCDCLNVTCSEEKEYRNGECRSVYRVTNSYKYQFCLHGQLVFNASVFQVVVEGSFLDYFMNLMKSLNAVIYMCSYDPTYISSCATNMTISFTFPCEVFFREPIKIDEFEQEIFALVDRDLNLTSYYSAELTFAASCPVDNDYWILNNDGTTRCQDYPPLYHWINTMDHKVDRPVLESTKNVELTRLLSCPRIFLTEDEAILSADKKSLTFVATNKTITTPDFSPYYGGSFIVCLDDYLDSDMEKLTCDVQIKASVKQSPKITTLGIMSGICTCLSVLFILITLLVFCMFKGLRTSVGLGIMALCVSLIVAQILFEFGAEQTEIKWVCQTIGIVTHFSWLSSTFWMNVCTASLFYKLNFPVESRLISNQKIMVYSTLYCWGCSIVIIAALILGSFLNDGSLGYGGSSCYISGSSGRRFGFALPVGILILINVILFTWTFITLKMHQKIQSTHESQISMLACLKLSVITGLTWIFAFLYEATGIIAFAYLFTLFVGSQGFVIFLAFVVNRRVSKLLKIRFGFTKKKNTQSQQSISKNDSGVGIQSQENATQHTENSGYHITGGLNDQDPAVNERYKEDCSSDHEGSNLEKY